jgi:hypothetical protein
MVISEFGSIKPRRYLTPFSGQTTMRPVMPGLPSRRYLFPVLLVCSFFSGAAGLIDQVVWSKTLELIFRHTAYAIAKVLAVFMAALASGSAWIGWRSDEASHGVIGLPKEDLLRYMVEGRLCFI